MILAGDVGGTKCNLALLSERDGRLTPVFKQRFRSKDFAKFDLLLGVRSEIGVAAFRRADAVTRAVPDKKSLSKPCASGEKRPRTAGLRNARI